MTFTPSSVIPPFVATSSMISSKLHPSRANSSAVPCERFFNQ